MSKRKTNKPTPSNDDIPADEMLLAETLAAVRARGLGGTLGTLFRDHRGDTTLDPSEAATCCALGGIVIARGIPCHPESGLSKWDGVIDGTNMNLITSGNDCWGVWSDHWVDSGESFGWAFRQAMDVR